MTNTLFLRLEGPLQSWGERSQWGIRDSAPEPTKSGIVGLLGCALGWQRDDQLRHLSQQIHIAVRCDRPGTMLIDYHTVGGGANTPQLLTAEGKPKASSGSPHTEQTWRHYLCDASFLVVVQTNSALITQLAEAVQNPCWSLFLGRKSCLPALPVFEGIGEYATLAEAMDRPWRRLEVDAPSRLSVRAVIESNNRDGVRRRHELVSRSQRLFGPSYTREIRLTITVLPIRGVIMILSRLRLNPNSRQVQRELADPYQMHRTILRAFPTPLPELERVLYRYDVTPPANEVLLLVQSQTHPDWSFLHGQPYLQTALFDPGDNPSVKTVDRHGAVFPVAGTLSQNDRPDGLIV